MASRAALGPGGCAVEAVLAHLPTGGRSASSGAAEAATAPPEADAAGELGRLLGHPGRGLADTDHWTTINLPGGRVPLRTTKTTTNSPPPGGERGAR